MDIEFIQKPYVYQNQVTGISCKHRIFTSGQGRMRAAIVVAKKSIDAILINQLSEEDTVIVEINKGNTKFIAVSIYLDIKSKGVPRQAKVAQEVPGRLSPWIFLTFRHYKGGRSSAKRTGRLYPKRNPWYSLSEAELTSGHVVLSGLPRKKSPVTPPGIDPGTVRLVAQRLNHYATPGPGLYVKYPLFLSEFDET